MGRGHKQEHHRQNLGCDKAVILRTMTQKQQMLQIKAVTCEKSWQNRGGGSWHRHNLPEPVLNIASPTAPSAKRAGQEGMSQFWKRQNHPEFQPFPKPEKFLSASPCVSLYPRFWDAVWGNSDTITGVPSGFGVFISTHWNLWPHWAFSSQRPFAPLLSIFTHSFLKRRSHEGASTVTAHLQPLQTISL